MPGRRGACRKQNLTMGRSGVAAHGDLTDEPWAVLEASLPRGEKTGRPRLVRRW
jgi:hypothetical protein